MILSCQSVWKAFGENEILKNASFHIEDYEKAAIVGINGAGKSTLLKIIVGELSADQGIITFAKDKTLGYLAQHQELQTEQTIYEELLSVKQYLIDLEEKIRTTELSMKQAKGQALEELMEQYTRFTHQFEQENGYAYKSEVTGVLKGLGFLEEDFSKSVSTLSGGQKTRVALGKLLLKQPDLIILDEPTNHLDMASIAWLETYLRSYKGAVILVSHDRYFLDKIAEKIVEVEHGNVTSFSGNYTDYAKKKEVLRISEMNAYLNQQREIKHQEEVIEKLRSFNREKSIKRAESREKMLNKIEVLDKPVTLKDDMNFTLTPRMISGNDVLQINELAKAYGSLSLFSHVSFEIKRGEHVAIIGKNGTGKTTLLKILNGLETHDFGTIRLGSNVEIGYYDQEHHVLHEDKTLFDEISDTYPSMTNTEIRNTLAAFLFTQDDVFKRIKDLSGGEKGRVSLAKLMLSNANFLILDEPTNHLDITSKEILENALNHYEGTLLYVSHDRYFINKTASRILDLENGNFHNYIGNYDYYVEKHEEAAALLPSAPSSLDTAKAPETISDTKADWQEQKKLQAEKRKRENRIQKIEAEIEAAEARQAELEAELLNPLNGTNVAKLQEISKEQEMLSLRLSELLEEWEALLE
ncbi:MAG: ATP-binding cassette domain-containing protein [Roseburia sp.]|nr:ATP-binding cassette domain-containing protein [Roseburia sp.]MCM1279451.1 ATP-binding cassette domain-containing protein [Robinsoniella sp.]